MIAEQREKNMQPEDLARSGSEIGEQTALFMWAQINQDKYKELKWLFAIPNGSYRDKITGARLKASGTKPGLPDIFFPIKRSEWSGLWIELKRVKAKNKSAGVVSSEQSKWIEFLKSQGFGAVVCYGWLEARDTIIKYLTYKN